MKSLAKLRAAAKSCSTTMVLAKGFPFHLPRTRSSPLVFRFTIIWESMIVIIREKRAEVIEIIWERVEPRAA
jgi:hypothetical protein